MLQSIKKWFTLIRDFPFILYGIVNLLKDIRDFEAQKYKERQNQNGKEATHE